MAWPKRIGAVVGVAWLVSIPVAALTLPQVRTPMWYAVLQALAGGLGIALGAIVVGLICLIASRDSPDGGIKSALVFTFIGALVSAFVMLRAA